jgi:hypothetical protein
MTARREEWLQISPWACWVGSPRFLRMDLQTFILLRNGKFGLAALNVVTANVVGLLLVWAGYVSSKAI